MVKRTMKTEVTILNTSALYVFIMKISSVVTRVTLILTTTDFFSRHP